jgi:hypothetical protein
MLKTVLLTLPSAEQYSEWFCHLKHGETLVQDCKLSGHPSTGPTDENVGKVHKIINRDLRSTILDNDV